MPPKPVLPVVERRGEDVSLKHVLSLLAGASGTSHNSPLLEVELSNLTQNLLGGLVSPILMDMISDREAELARLSAQTVSATARKPADILPPPVLLERFSQKVTALRTSLDDVTIRSEAASVLATLIESVTIYPNGEHGPEAEVVAKVSDLLAWATNDNAARKGGDRSSIELVAGTGFEPVTFRL
jgi:site-specific DNA recombinase